MRFLLDQDVYALTARFLIESGHDVVLVSQIGLSQAPDEEILSVAQQVHNELTRILSIYSETNLARAFVVVEPDGHRFRRPPL